MMIVVTLRRKESKHQIKVSDRFPDKSNVSEFDDDVLAQLMRKIDSDDRTGEILSNQKIFKVRRSELIEKQDIDAADCFDNESTNEQQLQLRTVIRKCGNRSQSIDNSERNRSDYAQEPPTNRWVMDVAQSTALGSLDQRGVAE